MTEPVNTMLAGHRLESAGDLVGALGAYTECIAKDPSDMDAWSRVGMVFVQLTKWQQAADNFDFVISQRPDHAEALHGLCIARYHLGDPAGARDLGDRAAAAAPLDWRIHASRAYVHATTRDDPAVTLALYLDWGRRFADPLTQAAEPFGPLTAARRDPRHRLRIGYVSGDLREHSVAFFMEPVFANHTDAVEVFVYSNGRPDARTARIASHVPNWFDVRALDDLALHALIREHEIDVLVDLSGHTEGQRLFVFARRAAPVQVTWLGFMHPLGMQAMDYRLTDRSTTPPGTEHLLSETPFHLACMACYAPPEAPLAAVPPMCRSGAPTFVSLNNSKKVTDAALRLWGRLLEARPDARLLLMVNEANQADALALMVPRLRRLGLPLARIQVSPQRSLADFMRLAEVADVALDTFPVSGGTTTLHAVWMGLPLIAMRSGDAAAGASANTLCGMGFDDWVSDDEDGYLERALAVVALPDVLLLHRKNVRARMATTALMDYPGRTRELEAAFRLMWINHLLGEKRFLDAGCSIDEAIEALPDPARCVADRPVAPADPVDAPSTSRVIDHVASTSERGARLAA